MEKHEVRERLMETVKDLYAKEGFDAVSLNQVLKEAGVSKGGLYWYFDSKEALFEAAFKECYEDILQATHSFDRTGMSAVDILKKRMICSLEVYIKDRRYMDVIENHLVYLAKKHNQSFYPYGGFKEDVYALVRQGIEAGEFADLPEEFLLEYVFTMNSKFAHFFVDKPQRYSEETVEKVMDAIFRAVIK